MSDAAATAREDDAAPLQGEPRAAVIQPGDRLIVGVWIALAIALGRALLQGFVDATGERERGELLVEHFVEHLLDATSRAWIVVPVLAVLPRGATRATILLRAAVAALLTAVLLAGWPDGELRYMPGTRSSRGFAGWGAIALAAVVFAAVDRYATSPRRGIFRLSPATRCMLTAGVLLVGGGSVGVLMRVIDLRRENMQVEGIVRDLLDDLPTATIIQQPPNAPIHVGSILADRGEAESGGNKPSLVLPCDAAVEFSLPNVPPRARLTLSFAVDRGSLRPQNPPQQLVTFTVLVDGREVVGKTLRPQEQEADRCWFDRSIDLADAAGSTVRIRLATRGQGQDLGQVRPGFGRPLLVCDAVRPRVPIAPERLNVVLIVVDSQRADHLGCYGYGRATSPNIDALAREGLVYENAFTPASWTWPAMASLLTGLHPPTHGVNDVDRCFLSDSVVTLPELLQAAGYTTLGCSANPLITRAKNFQQGFEVWREFPMYSAPRLSEEFEDWVRRYKGYQFFAFVHILDPHRPFNPPELFATRFARPEDATAMRVAVNELRARAETGSRQAEELAAPQLSAQALVDLYDGELLFVDAQIGRMRKLLEREGLLHQTLFIVTSDHGEWLGAGVPPPAGASLARELLHVPLIVRDPRRAPQRIPDVVDLTFLAPTILAAVDAKSLPGGPTLLPWPPWGVQPLPFAFSHTARGIVGATGDPAALIGLIDKEFRLVLRTSGEPVEFEQLRPGARGAEDRERQRESLTRRLRSWYEFCNRSAVARPFERMDYATRFWLEQLGDVPDK